MLITNVIMNHCCCFDHGCDGFFFFYETFYTARINRTIIMLTTCMRTNLIVLYLEINGLKANINIKSKFPKIYFISIQEICVFFMILPNIKCPKLFELNYFYIIVHDMSIIN